MTTEPPSQPPKSETWIYGGLAALCASFLVQMIESPPEAGSYLYWSAIFFAVSLPLLVTSFIMETREPGVATRKDFWLLFSISGTLASLAGCGLAFLHINLHAGSIFLVVGGLCLLLLLVSVKRTR